MLTNTYRDQIMDLFHRRARLTKQPHAENVGKCNKKKTKFRVTRILKGISAITLSISRVPRHFFLTYIVITGVKHSIWYCCAHLIFLLIEPAY